MEIYVKEKTLGKGKDILAPAAYTVPDGIRSLRQLITALAEAQAARYNSKAADPQPFPLLTARQIHDQAQTGKVGFGRIYSEKTADPQKAVSNAIQCFEDGLVRILLNETPLTDLDAPLEIPQGAVLTCIRLTFLTGSLW